MSGGNVTIEAILPATTISEGPFWQPEYGALIYVDIIQGKVHRYFPKTQRKQELKIDKCTSGDTVSFVLPMRNHPDMLLIGHGREVSGVKWSHDAPDRSTAKATSLVAIDQGKLTRFNDAKCDLQGRIWAGTMGFETEPGKPEMNQGSLFRFTSELKPTKCVEKVSISNGLAWSGNKNTMYYIDTCTYKVEEFDYDDATGDITNRRSTIDYKDTNIPTDLPDGMAIDASGKLWVANYGGRKVICVDPVTKKIVRTIDMPTKNPTSVCFGGTDYETMYVTSGRPGMSDDELKAAPTAGALFEIKGLGVKGLPSVTAVIDDTVIAKIK